MQVAVVRALATEILERPAIARIVAAMGVVPEARPCGRERSGSWTKGSGVRLRRRAGKSNGGGDENRKSCECHAPLRPRRSLRPSKAVPISRGESFARANLPIQVERAIAAGRGEIEPQKQQNCEGFGEMGHHSVAPKAGGNVPASRLRRNRKAEIQITFFLSDKIFSFQEGLTWRVSRSRTGQRHAISTRLHELT